MTDTSALLPIGAVVLYEHGEKRCPMVIVALAPGSERDPETLYFATEYRGDLTVYVEWPDLPLYSNEFLSYALEVGWSVGNADRHLFKDTGKRVKVVSYAKARRQQP